MENKQRTIYVYENWTGIKPNQIGILYVQYVRGEEIFSFEYSTEFLKNNKYNFLDPDLEFFEGKQYLSSNKNQFGIFMDSEPDRWGRTLLKRKENEIAKKEGRLPRKLYEADYLLGVDDYTRMGGLRFAEWGPFLTGKDKLSVPPLKRLRELENASLKYEDDSSIDDEWLNILLSPGSSLGGARPKANIIDLDGSLWIAKFPSKHDEYDMGAWEFVVHELAKLCGLNVPEAKLYKFSKYGSTFLCKRFDREKERRIHFSSAMTLLGKTDGESSQSSYVELGDFIKAYGSNSSDDLHEIWKRIVFSMLVKNTDDHLRNHGFLLGEKGWRLSPMYDVNINPEGSYLSLNVINESNEIDLNLALSVTDYFDISKKEGSSFIETSKEIITSNWKKLAKENGISNSSIDLMEHVFVY